MVTDLQSESTLPKFLFRKRFINKRTNLISYWYIGEISLTLR